MINAASANCFKILCDRNFPEGYWRFIWCFCICCMHSKIADKLGDGTPLDGILLCDRGYACRAYLLTLKPKNAVEVRYNTAHKRTRCVIERCFVLLKRRFPCLHLGLRTVLPNTLVIIVATLCSAAIFALIHREQDFDEDI